MPIDYKKYPPNWKTEIRPRILKRAKNCCEQCGVENKKLILRGNIKGLDVYQDLDGYIYDAKTSKKIGENYLGKVDEGGDNEVIKIVLTIAHLDHDETNWDVTDDRLKALCQKCHLAYDAPEKAKRRRKKKYKNSLFPIK